MISFVYEHVFPTSALAKHCEMLLSYRLCAALQAL